MSWLSDLTGVNVDIGSGTRRIAESVASNLPIKVGGVSLSDAISGVVDAKNERARQARALYKELQGLFGNSIGDIESSLYSGLKQEFDAFQGSSDWEGIFDSLSSISSRFKSGMGDLVAKRGDLQKFIDRSKGNTTLLGGGARYEQLLTKETLNLQQEPEKKQKSLLTEDTIMATNKKAQI